MTGISNNKISEAKTNANMIATTEIFFFIISQRSHFEIFFMENSTVQTNSKQISALLNDEEQLF